MHFYFFKPTSGSLMIFLTFHMNSATAIMQDIIIPPKRTMKTPPRFGSPSWPLFSPSFFWKQCFVFENPPPYKMSNGVGSINYSILHTMQFPAPCSSFHHLCFNFCNIPFSWSARVPLEMALVYGDPIRNLSWKLALVTRLLLLSKGTNTN